MIRAKTREVRRVVRRFLSSIGWSAPLAILWVMILALGIARSDLAVPVPVITVPTDFPGVMYVPADGQPHPGVLLLHGLEGGSATDRTHEAQLLAAQGFAAMALCWYGCDAPGIPLVPQGIDLSRTYEAFRWLRSSRFVKNRPTAVYGVSRGAEQALVLSVYLAKHPEYPSPTAIVVHAPSEQIQAAQAGLPAWTWQGDVRGMQPGSLIRLDRYSGSLLVTHGVDDSQQPISSSHDFEQALRASGAAVRTFLHDADPLLPPLIVEPTQRGPVRADFHYFKGEGSRFDPAMDAIRMSAVIAFLQSVLGS